MGYIPSLRWRHDGRDGVSNHQPDDCLLNSLFGLRSKKTSSSASLAFVWGIHRGPVNSPHKWPITRKMFPFDDVVMTEYTKSAKIVSMCFSGAISDLYYHFTDQMPNFSRVNYWSGVLPYRFPILSASFNKHRGGDCTRRHYCYQEDSHHHVLTWIIDKKFNFGSCKQTLQC